MSKFSIQLFCGIAVLFLCSCRISYKFLTIGLPKPDRKERTGTFAGYEFHLWNCVDGKRVIVYRWEPEMPFFDFDPYHKEETACNEKTEFERKNGILEFPLKK
ncbi:hypothetical protein JWG44_11015 [Leptospira sp. 201903071]|uniref:hypothetical protein n=1 Tax=Leptospira ainazelensis TaxID=2810034 RepID=UPI0019633348|nr:hypothetical protein [Leptospira ainazelensis]MBM9500777.1 hypothetical protein [Leptospira ainazelensis]